MRCAYDPIYDINPLTGIVIEVFYTDRTLETFGRGFYIMIRFPVLCGLGALHIVLQIKCFCGIR